jgi:ubiquinone biosynthesis protein COQ9
MTPDARKLADRDRVIMAALPHVTFDGWSWAALKRGASDAGLPEIEAEFLFPSGGTDAVTHFIAMADRMMMLDYAAQENAQLKHRQKIARIIRLRLERWTPHRDAVRRALALAPMPSMVGPALQGWYATVDAMWRAIGDTSIDFNFYTKRALLAGVYGSTFLFWLNDRSSDCSATWAFLDRRIENVMQVPKLRGKIMERLSRLPTPRRLAERMSAFKPSGRM